MEARAFLGRWHVTREIADRLGPDARFEGVARISEADDGGWIYHETGRLGLAGGPGFEAERRYLWRPGSGGIDIAFADGRPFHRMPLEGGSARHLCPPDTYEVRYEFAAWPLWEAVWTVSGPRKDYVMHSRYRQQDLQSGAPRG